MTFSCRPRGIVIRAVQAVGFAAGLVGGVFAVGRAEAQTPYLEPTVTEAPMVTHLSIPRRQLNPEVTTVLDSFDVDNPFDLHASFGFSFARRTSRIRREIADPTISSRGYLDTADIADFTHETYTLSFGLAVGLYRDLQVHARLPLILQDTRRLAYPPGADTSAIDNSLIDLPFDGPCGTPPCAANFPLFEMPFESPKRSGVDYFEVGIAWGPLNQERDDTKPTWVFGLDFRFPIGNLMQAGSTTGSPSSMNWPGAVPTPTTPTPPVGRFIYGLGAHSVFSHRYRYVAPFIGAWFRYDAPTQWGLFPAGRLTSQQNEGRLNRYPPLWGMMSFGVEIIPWENAENYQRFGIELRVDGMYNSEGREYSELFDALGTSAHPGLHPCFQDATGTQRCVDDDPTARITGQTDVENYGTLRTSAALNIQAARYIKFTVHGSLSRVQDHLITFTDACNPGASISRAPCIEGAPNPDHRPVIDLPGRRFHSTNGFGFEVGILGTAMF